MEVAGCELRAVGGGNLKKKKLCQLGNMPSLEQAHSRSFSIPLKNIYISTIS